MFVKLIELFDKYEFIVNTDNITAINPNELVIVLNGKDEFPTRALKITPESMTKLIGTIKVMQGGIK